MSVVGVARDATCFTLSEANSPVIYLPFEQHPHRGAPRSILVRFDGRTVAAAADVLRRELRAIDPDMALDVRPMKQLVRAELQPHVAGTVLTGVFGGLAVLLGAVCVYSLVAIRTEARRREVAVRMALGGSASHIVRLASAWALRVLVVGCLAGAVLTKVVASMLENAVPGVQGLGPPWYGLVVAIVVVAVFAGAAVPILRACRVEPMSVLRSE